MKINDLKVDNDFLIGVLKLRDDARCQRPLLSNEYT